MGRKSPRPACSSENGRPSTKSGAIRALWPEIQQALHSGQTLKTVRDWLEADGVPLKYNQLATYVARIRQKQARVPTCLGRRGTNRPCKLRLGQKTTGRFLKPGQYSETLCEPRSREGRSRTFEYNPEFKEEDLL